MMQKIKRWGVLLVCLLLILSGCKADLASSSPDTVSETTEQTSISNVSEATLPEANPQPQWEIPQYAGAPYTEIHNNIPFFTDDEITNQSFETYSPLDALGRCGVAFACVGQDLMPTEERGSIGQVKPSGWHLVKYDCVDGKYLYNRCHLIGYQLTAENANERNLITGTRYLNIEGMLPFENQVADYVLQTGNHVLYRVTPFFEDDNLLASGVLMEGYSVEDSGNNICFCIYAYNIQPGVQIDYATGESVLADAVPPETTEQAPPEDEPNYVLNHNTRKFHRPNCSSVEDIKPSNREDYFGSREALIEQGYAPCKLCCP
ncbi:DNA/RNA non-specific endonuclease [Agathobaculum sp. Marseille-P7918]|uniref:DNA/RNA non-specific endonuclease n=1 Tax=Agathobaculum sp. Marseille-P7918 TaxID=2479843 RepID=UPI003FA41C12